MSAVWNAIPGIATAAGGIAGLFGGKKKNPAAEAGKYLDQIPGQIKPYYDPYINAGRSALGTAQGEYNTGINDPNSTYNKLAQGYKESPGYKFQLQKALGAAQNASAAGGMLGTPQDQQQQAQVASDISSQYFEKYLNHMFGIYNQGVAGNQHISDEGFDASTSYGNALGQVTGQKANNAYNQANSDNQDRQRNWSNIIGGVGGAFQGYNQGQQQQELLDWLKSHGGY